MKFLVVLACLAVGVCAALPSKPAQASALDLLKDLETLVEEDGKVLISKALNVIHYVEQSILKVKELVPKEYEKVHQEADEVLAGIKKVTEQFEELLGKKNVYFSFDLLGGLTELSGGTKLGTVLQLISLADKAHRLITDAKEFVPRLGSTLDRMQAHIEQRVKEFSAHVLKELGLQDMLTQKSVMNKIEGLFEKVQLEGHKLILALLHSMEETFDILEQKLPEEYKRVQKAVEKVRAEINKMIVEIEKTLVMRSFNLLDIAGDMSEGTSLSTAFKVMSLVDKFNTVVQDVRNFGPRAETHLQHSVKKVADRAQEFFTHAANRLLEA